MLDCANSEKQNYLLSRYRPTEIVYSQQLNQTALTMAQLIVHLLSYEQLWSVSTLYIWTLACFTNVLQGCQVYFKEAGRVRVRVDQGQEYKTIKKVVGRINNKLAEIMSLLHKTNPKQVLASKSQLEEHLKIIEVYLDALMRSVEK